MIIVDYSKDYYGSKVETLTFSSDASLIDFVADSSECKDFKVHRINKYSAGYLTPHDLEFNSGRIVLAKQPMEAK